MIKRIVNIPNKKTGIMNMPGEEYRDVVEIKNPLVS